MSQFVCRSLEATDYHKGFVSLLKQLTHVGEYEENLFLNAFDKIDKNDDHFVIVIEDIKTERIVGTGTILIEQKFIHHCGLVAHIEDVVVDTEYRGHQLGSKLVDNLKNIAVERGVYKIILDCADKNEIFYTKCGFVKSSIQMSMRY